MTADLHIHTTFSDGMHSPAEVVDLANKVGLKTIAITDHDMISGIAPAKEAGEKLGIEVVPGIEFTTEHFNTEVHVLGYFVDCQSAFLLENLEKIQKGREERVFKVCDKLRALGINLSPEKVFAIAGHHAPGRPHIARALVNEGVVSDFKEAFDKYLEFNGPAYVSHYKLTPENAIGLVLQASGVPVYAHPGVSACDQIIPDLILAGLAGIEVYYSGHKPGQTQHYLNLAKKYGLLVTGGSDYHGFSSGREVEIGAFYISDELMDKLRNEHLRGN